VTVYVDPGVTVVVDEINPPAPPPPARPYPPPPPPAITKYSTDTNGVTLLLAALAGPVPTLLVAVTVNVYAVPLVRPVTVIGDADPVAVTPPGLDVTV
jgi:hypothetical protein